jgi:response regulator RpfG family c-di-GMP phosphodiesterase
LPLILSHAIAHDENRKNRCFRVSIYASRIAEHLRLGKNAIEDIRSAVLLYDLGQVELNRSVLRKALAQWLAQAKASGEEDDDDTFDEHFLRLSEPMCRILLILLGIQEQTVLLSEEQEKSALLGARILAVADAYDTLTFVGDRNQRAVSPEKAHDAIVGAKFDPEVVQAFTIAFKRAEMELPTIIL